MHLHQSHNWRYSDSSQYDAVCTQCNYTDTSPQAKFPCGETRMDRLLELAKEAGLKAQSEIALSPAEKKFAEALINECAVCITKPKIASEFPHDIATKELVQVLVNDMKNHFGI